MMITSIDKLGHYLIMECKIISRAGQTLARGRLFLENESDGSLRLNFQTNRGTLIKGGLVAEDGDLRAASDELFENCHDYWGLSGMTLNVSVR